MSKLCTVRILDEVNCVIVGLDKHHYKELQDTYSPYADGYFYSKKYKMGIWDGRISFFSKGGRTYTKLLPEMLLIIHKWGYRINLVDNRSPINLSSTAIDKDYFKKNNDTVELGNHQVEAVNAILENQGGIILAATGAGKSWMIATLSDYYSVSHKLKVLIIVPSVDLIEQMKDDFTEALELDVGEYSGTLKDIDHPIVISTWQSLQNNEKILHMFNVCIVDECHGASGEVIKSLLNNYGSHLYIKIGVTGTLPKADTDRMSVKVTLGDPVYIITAKQLIDMGWLAEVDIKLLELEENFKEEYANFRKNFPDESKKITYAKFLENMYPDFNSEKAYLSTRKERIDFISMLIAEKNNEKKGNVLVLVNGVSVGKKLQTLVPGSYFVYGKDKKATRKKIYSLFAENDNICVIATSQLASTGLNIPRIFTLFLVDAGKSYIRTIQSIGRGLRKAHDKTKVLVIDIYSNLKYSRGHKNERVSHYKEAQYNHSITKTSYR